MALKKKKKTEKRGENREKKVHIFQNLLMRF